MSLKDVPVRARLWAPDRSLPRFFGRLLLFFVRFNLTSFAQYLRAAETRGGVAQACRAAPSGDEDVRKCCPREPCCTLGRRRCTKVSLKRAALYPRATKMYESVAQESRAAPSGDDKCGFSLPKGFLHPYVILPCALGQREGAEESPDCASRHLRVRDSQASSFPESSAPSPAPVVGGVQGAGRMVVRPLYRPLYPAYSFDIWKFLLLLS
jgi:hypothetical protein